jgi:hypothetical protein
MTNALYRKIEELQNLTVDELQQRHREVYGEAAQSRHKQHLVRRIAWRLQVLALGDLSERARRHGSNRPRRGQQLLNRNVCRFKGHHITTRAQFSSGSATQKPLGWRPFSCCGKTAAASP